MRFRSRIVLGILAVGLVVAGGQWLAPRLIDPLPRDQRAQVDALLQEYDLHRGGPAKIGTSTQTMEDQGFYMYAEFSKEIGLPLESYSGKPVQWYTFPLRERTTAPDGRIDASFALVDGKVVGAGLYLVDYGPGVTALNDRRAFKE